MNKVANTVVAFKIGRGGRFNNSGFKTFEGFNEINEFIGDLFTNEETGEMYDESGNDVGLNADNDGTGTIDIDGEYNTTICKRLSHCDENELEMILKSNTYMEPSVKEYIEEAIKEKIGY